MRSFTWLTQLKSAPDASTLLPEGSAESGAVLDANKAKEIDEDNFNPVIN